MERNKNRKRRRRSETPAAPSHCRTRMEWTIRNQVQQLTQRPQTVGHLANLVATGAASKEVQWLAMMTWMEDR
jgi:hypothetical protein